VSTRTGGELQLTLEDHERAFTEVSFLLEMLVRTAGEVVGRSMPSLGTNAGRQVGRKLPIAPVKPELEPVLRVVFESLSAGFDIAGECTGSGADLRVGRCVVRDVCQQQGLELGGELCKAFHHYLAGMMAQLLGRPARPGAVGAGPTCTLRVEVQR
jgi:hypothetical protein